MRGQVGALQKELGIPKYRCFKWRVSTCPSHEPSYSDGEDQQSVGNLVLVSQIGSALSNEDKPDICKVCEYFPMSLEHILT